MNVQHKTTLKVRPIQNFLWLSLYQRNPTYTDGNKDTFQIDYI